jgi:putative peptidoglycan lipid II flippase
MSLGTLSSRFLGLFREVLLAALFDRVVTDAWSAAFKLPNLFRRLLGEGSLSVSFQPILIETETHDHINGSHRARDLSASLHAFLISLLTIITVSGILFAHPVLNFILDADYVARTEAFLLTVRLAQIMFGFLFFISLFAYYMAILNAHGKFGWPAAAPVFFNISLIVSTLLPQNILSTPGDFLAWGVLLGGFLQMAVLVPQLFKFNLWPGFKWNFSNPDLLRVLRNMVPGLFALGLAQITLIINMGFASSLGEGVISYIAWADRLLELPLSLISVSLGTALLPALSEHWSQGDRTKMVQTSERFVSLNLFVSAMAACGLYVLAEPIVRLLFERGRFSFEDSKAVISVVQIYALSMIPISLVRVLVPAYFAVKNTWFPATVSFFGLILHVILAPQLMKLYGLSGLNFSSLISASLNFILLILFYGKFVHTFEWAMWLKKTLKTLLASFLMVLSMFALLNVLPTDAYALTWALQVVLVGFCGVVIYFISAGLFKHPETDYVISRFRKKLMKRGRY